MIKLAPGWDKISIIKRTYIDLGIRVVYNHVDYIIW